MTVSQLIEKLSKLDSDTLVVLSIDAEGNWHEPVGYVELMGYDETDHSVGLLELTDTLKKEGYCEEDIMEDGVKAVVLYP